MLVASVVALTGGGKQRWLWLIVLLAFAASVSQAEQPLSSGLRACGLGLLLFSVGPVFVNPTAVAIRSAAWNLTVKGLTVLTTIFIVWYLLHLPSFGAGFFSTFMGHCMLLGPVAGMGVGIATAHALQSRSWRWGLLAFLGFIPVLASGSRVATIATAASVCFLLFRKLPLLGLVCVLLCLVTVYKFSRTETYVENVEDSLLGAIAYKGNKDTRTDLWQARLAEFKSSPIFGIGIAMGTGSGSAVEESGNIRVEPGSCYLAVLAMTGGFGTVAFCSALAPLLFGFVSSPQKHGLGKDILGAVGIFMAVHGLAEGWILSFGSPLCFLFWLWLGNFGDVVMQVSHPVAQACTRTQHKFKRPIPALS